MRVDTRRLESKIQWGKRKEIREKEIVEFIVLFFIRIYWTCPIVDHCIRVQFLSNIDGITQSQQEHEQHVIVFPKKTMFRV